MPRVLAALVALALPALAALPVRKPDLTDAVVEKVAEPTEAEKKDGVAGTVFVKGRKAGIVIKKDTPLHKQMGKLVPVAEVADLKPDARLSVWLADKSDAAEAILIFP